MLAGPEYLVTTSFVTDSVEAALRSGNLGPDYVWPERLSGRWYHYLAPAPAELRFYDALFKGTAGCALERGWPPASRVPLEFPAPEIRLYRRARP